MDPVDTELSDMNSVDTGSLYVDLFDTELSDVDLFDTELSDVDHNKCKIGLFRILFPTILLPKKI